MSATIARFNISEYERMIDAGVFDTRRGHTIELIRGELREMFPVNFDHATIAKFSISEYERMIDAGIFDTRQGHTIELIRGELREMFPINFDHATIVNYLTRWSIQSVSAKQAMVQIQQPIRCPDDEAVPQPDVSWIKPVKRRPWPLPEDVLLLIEVADSSLTGDQTEKAAIYATAGIADYWIVNIPDQCVEVRRKPTPSGYQETMIYQRGEQVHPLNFPAVELGVEELFDEIGG